jgi:DNA mismatch repair protein MutS
VIYKRALSLVLFSALFQACLLVASKGSAYSSLAQSYIATQPSSDDGFDPLQNPLTHNEMRALALKFFEPRAHLAQKKATIAGADVWSDIDFVSMFSKINCTHSALGEAAFLEKLLAPMTDVARLAKRQVAIQSMVNDQKLFGVLKRNIELCADSEDFMLMPWSEKDEGLVEKLNSLYFHWWKFKDLNTSPYVLEASTRLAQFGFLKSLLLLPAQELANGFHMNAIDGQNDSMFGALSQAFGDVRNFTFLTNIAKLFQGQSSLRERISALNSIGNICFIMPYYLSVGVDYQKELHRSFIYCHARLIAIMEFLNGLKRLHDYIAQCAPELRDALEDLSEIKNLYSSSSKIEPRIRELLELLNTSTFQGEPTMFSFTGRVLAANKILTEIKQHLVPSLRAFGEIDAFFSVACLVKKHESKKAQFSLVNFAPPGNGPCVELTDFWNPVLSPAKAVLNSMELNKKTAANAVITGANAAGKSTMLKAVTLNLILAQTFGIAGARLATISPFAKINTYFHVNDDIDAGNSLFKAEVLRAKSLLQSLVMLKSGELAFLAMDEMFTGTSPYEAMVACYAYCTLLAQCGNASCLLATHFKLLTKLEETYPGIFKNFCIDGVVNPDDTITYPYVLHPGISKENVAFAMLRKEGVLSQKELDAALAIAQTI